MDEGTDASTADDDLELPGGWRGCLDAPVAFEPFAERVEVRGWVLAPTGESARVRVHIDGALMVELKNDGLRADVGEHHPDVPNSHLSGFVTTVGRGDLPARDQYRLRVDAVGSDGTSLVVAERILSWTPASSVVHQRGDYRVVWNEVSGDLADARVSVCGSADDAEWERTGVASANTIEILTRITATSRVIEIGCGAGRIGRHLAPRCGQWTGADVSTNMLDHARSALAHLPNVSFLSLHGSDLRGVADESVDVVYCSAVFMHLDEWDRFRYVTEMYRVLVPGGRVYFDNFNLLGDEGWAFFTDMAAHDPVKRPPNISKSSTPQELRHYAERAGFVDVRVVPHSLWITVDAQKPS